MSPQRAPVVSVHGLWLHSTSWEPRARLFAEGEYDPLMEICESYAQVVRGLPAPASRRSAPPRARPSSPSCANRPSGPLLLLSGKRDHTIPDVLTRSTQKQYRNSPAFTDYQRFEDRGHSLVIDSGRRTIAETPLGLLNDNAH
ncbi:hypothetical protein [Streptomyces spectabilis]|uniref:Alpha/beta hydrolase n=1 Tax=Streptomyces spectabilis TaxID=68270 RepID=A0A516R3Q4_STRST|nr:hypothetical protein [Streptomyces spectabilis]QDQ10278.1 hypothetical protein FH965_06645 [Streptomyces spectabilis]